MNATASTPDEGARLWEVDHPYYCAETNYFARGPAEQPGTAFKSWAEFVDEEGDADMDYNLLFRWDWQEGEDYDLAPFNGDLYYRNGHLMLFFMGQRKGFYRWVTVEVCRADEPAIRDWLQPRFARLLTLWAPFA